jgi:hypothetical protein
MQTALMIKRAIGKVLRKTGMFDRFFHKRDLDYSFQQTFGYAPNVRAVRTFNEKLYRRKLLVDDRFTELADKVLVKNYVRRRLGKEFLIPTLYAGSQLPPLSQRNWPIPFVIKSNHGSGGHIFVRSDEECDWQKIERTIDHLLSADYSLTWGERFYSKIKRQVLIEPFLSDDGKLPIDYKLFVFNSEPKLIQVDTDRETKHKRVFYDLDWKRQNIAFVYPTDEREMAKPKSLGKMITAASTLAKGLDFVRIDFYEIGGKPYFGEMTFTPEAGLGRFDPPENDRLLGEMWQ